MPYSELISNLETVCKVPVTEILPTIHGISAIPSLIILFASSFIILLAVGLASIRDSYRNFFKIYFATLFFSGIVFTLLLIAPNTLHQFMEWITNLF